MYFTTTPSLPSTKIHCGVLINIPSYKLCNKNSMQCMYRYQSIKQRDFKIGRR